MKPPAAPLRRRLLAVTGLGLAGSLALPAFAAPHRVLPAATEGPFYPPRAWREDWGDEDADLTQVRRGAQVLQARGERLGLQATVVDADGRPVDGAEVEIWQCDSFAHYRHPRVPALAGSHDPGFQGFGASRSDADGRVRFIALRPVAYPGRTPHIHLKLRHASFGTLTSQLYVQGDPGNAADGLFRRLDAADQAAVSMRLQPAPADSGLRWQVQHTLTVPA